MLTRTSRSCGLRAVSILLTFSLSLIGMACSPANNGSIPAPADAGASGDSAGTMGFGTTGGMESTPPPATGQDPSPPASQPPSQEESDPPSSTPETCTADCAGKHCGDDGCGSTCGSCNGGQSCDAGICVADVTDVPDVPALGDGACTNPADVPILETGTVSGTVEECAMENIDAVLAGDKATVIGCVKDQTGLTDGCLVCFSDLFDCTMAQCPFQCLSGTENPDCINCLTTACYPSFIDCSGVDPANE